MVRSRGKKGKKGKASDRCHPLQLVTESRLSLRRRVLHTCRGKKHACSQSSVRDEIEDGGKEGR